MDQGRQPDHRGGVWLAGLAEPLFQFGGARAGQPGAVAAQGDKTFDPPAAGQDRRQAAAQAGGHGAQNRHGQPSQRLGEAAGGGAGAAAFGQGDGDEGAGGGEAFLLRVAAGPREDQQGQDQRLRGPARRGPARGTGLVGLFPQGRGEKIPQGIQQRTRGGAQAACLRRVSHKPFLTEGFGYKTHSGKGRLFQLR